MTEPASSTVTHRLVLSLAIPMTLAYMSTPLVGLVDLAVIGQLDDASLLGGIAIASVIFDVILTAFNMLRTGTTGLVAQACGRGDTQAQRLIFWRSSCLALAAGLLIVVGQGGLWFLAGHFFAPDPALAEAAFAYFTLRMISVPFALLNFTLQGLIIGQGRSWLSLGLQTLLNGLNIVLSLVFVLVFRCRDRRGGHSHCYQ
jgi:MATE family multidrug resistance protein